MSTLSSRMAKVSVTERKGILKMPSQLLSSVAEFCDPPTDLLALRYTHPIIEYGIRNVFVRHYISELWCFMLDPRRLQRVINIMEHPRFAKTGLKVQLTLIAHEQRTWRPMVANVSEHWAEHDAIQAYAIAEYDRLECIESGISVPAWTRIERIMSLLSRRDRSSIVLDVHGERSVMQRIAPQRPQLPSNLLDLARRSGCKVSGLHISDSFDVDAREFSPTQRFHSFVNRMEAFGYVRKPGPRLDSETPKALRQLELVKVVSGSAQNLKECRLTLKFGTWRLREESLSVTGRLLSGPRFPSLRDVRLGNLQCRQSDLLGFLDRCPDTLEELLMTRVEIDHAGDPLTHILIASRRFSNLRLSMNNVRVRRDEQTSLCAVFNVFEEGTKYHKTATIFENVDATPFLKLNIRDSLLYDDESAVWNS